MNQQIAVEEFSFPFSLDWLKMKNSWISIFSLKIWRAQKTGTDIFKLAKEHISNFSLLWKKCVGVFTDQYPSRLGIYRTCRPKKSKYYKHPQHDSQLISKYLNTGVLIVIQEVNFIKSRPHVSNFFSDVRFNGFQV